MTFSFSTSIPAASNYPGDDQPQMLINNASTSGLVAVDHIGFNVSGGGQHKQVTFNSNNVPSIPTTPPVLFTNTVSGLAQLFFYSGDNAHSAAQYVNAGSGSTYLLGGIILKWGSATITGTQSVSFASAFPNNCYAVVPVTTNAAGPTIANDYVYINSISTSSFSATYARRTSLTSNSGSFYYVAIGN